MKDLFFLAYVIATVIVAFTNVIAGALMILVGFVLGDLLYTVHITEKGPEEKWRRVLKNAAEKKP